MSSLAIYLKLCERTLSFAVSLREEGEVALLESPNGLGATAASAYAEKCRNVLQFHFNQVDCREQNLYAENF